MDLREIDELTAKLKKKGDITKKEADRLFSPFSRQRAILNVKSKSYDPFLCKALNRWFEAVLEQIKAGRKGNFITTIPLMPKIDLGYDEQDFLKLCIQNLPTEDLFSKMLISSKTYEKLPANMKKFFGEGSYGGEKYYVRRNFRAGAFGPFKGITEGFAPVFDVDWQGFCDPGFKIATGAYEHDGKSWLYAGMNEARLYVIAGVIKKRNITPLCVDFLHRKSVLMAAGDDMPFVKKALEIPFENLARQALKRGIITGKMFDALGKNTAIRNFPIAEFADFCIRCLNTIAEMKTEKEILEREIIESDEWIVTDR